MLTMTKRLEFDAGHRLMNHESKCANVHGHRYAVDVTLELTGALDGAGRIVDFGDVKRVFGGWLDDNLDHACIVNQADGPLRAYLTGAQSKAFVFPSESSAENLAMFLLARAAELLDVDGTRRVTSLVLFETPTSSARATR